MKNIFLLLFILTIYDIIFAQEMTFYSGNSFTFGKINQIDKNKKSNTRRLNPSLGFVLGYNISYKIDKNNKNSILFGMEVNQNRISNFIIDSISDLKLDTFNLDRNLILTKVTFPFLYERKINKSSYFNFGYSFSYIIDKNHNFVFVQNSLPLIFQSAFNRFQHNLNFGLGYSYRNFKFNVNYNLFMNKIYDTRNKIVLENVTYNGLESEYLKINAISFTISIKV